jgi:hypothetical protein
MLYGNAGASRNYGAEADLTYKIPSDRHTSRTRWYLRMRKKASTLLPTPMSSIRRERTGADSNTHGEK